MHPLGPFWRLGSCRYLIVVFRFHGSASGSGSQSSENSFQQKRRSFFGQISSDEFSQKNVGNSTAARFPFFLKQPSVPGGLGGSAGCTKSLRSEIPLGAVFLVGASVGPPLRFDRFGPPGGRLLATRCPCYTTFPCRTRLAKLRRMKSTYWMGGGSRGG